jgi:hypothetical protein
MRDVTAPEKPSSSTFTELNVRQEKGKPHFIRLHDSVVKRLERYLVENPASTGLLLGSVEVNDNCTRTSRWIHRIVRYSSGVSLKSRGLRCW